MITSGISTKVVAFNRFDEFRFRLNQFWRISLRLDICGGMGYNLSGRSVCEEEVKLGAFEFTRVLTN
jgi:hypothetical protein